MRQGAGSIDYPHPHPKHTLSSRIHTLTVLADRNSSYGFSSLTPRRNNTPQTPARQSERIAEDHRRAIFFISGCGIGTQNPGSTSASSHSVVDEQTTKSELENLAQELKSNVSSDPKSLTGPSSAKNTPEVQPMVETPTPQLPVTFKDFKGDEVTVKSANRILALDLYGTLAQEVAGFG